LHRAAYTDADFRSALADETDRGFCIGCHAPAATSDGIDCLGCHATPGSHAERGAGPVTTVPCASCHEFAFPHEREKMQTTASEHAASPYASVACAACHMPRGDHAFAASRDLAALAAALDVRAARTSPTSIAVTLRSRGVGHDFPTGDLFRRLRVWAWAEDARGVVVADAERTLARDFVDRDGGRHQGADTRVSPNGPSVIDLDLGKDASGCAVEVRVYYERVAEERAGRASLFASNVIGAARVEGSDR